MKSMMVNPLASSVIQLIKEHGDDTPISWLHRDDRFYEKLATQMLLLQI
jgi:magnesium chelatase subunit I